MIQEDKNAIMKELTEQSILTGDYVKDHQIDT